MSFLTFNNMDIDEVNEHVLSICDDLDLPDDLIIQVNYDNGLYPMFLSYQSGSFLPIIRIFDNLIHLPIVGRIFISNGYVRTEVVCEGTIDLGRGYTMHMKDNIINLGSLQTCNICHVSEGLAKKLVNAKLDIDGSYTTMMGKMTLEKLFKHAIVPSTVDSSYELTPVVNHSVIKLINNYDIDKNQDERRLSKMVEDYYDPSDCDSEIVNNVRKRLTMIHPISPHVPSSVSSNDSYESVSRSMVSRHMKNSDIVGIKTLLNAIGSRNKSKTVKNGL